MKKLLFLLLLAAALCLSSASAENTGILGQPFPDFTAVDTQGNTFTLSEALKDHEAVLVNIWATWCPPCDREFPFLNEVYAQYGDRVAFIALSCEPGDSLEKIADYRESRGLSFPMGRDEELALSTYLGVQAIPTTVIVDRFGNAAFIELGSFSGADKVRRLVEAFLGEGYTETKVLDAIPKDASTKLFPVSAVRAVQVENENAQRIIFRAAGHDDTLTAYVVNDSAARLRLEVGASDSLGSMVYYDAGTGVIKELPSLLDGKQNAFIYEQLMPAGQDQSPYTYGVFTDIDDPNDPDVIELFLIPGDDGVEAFAELLRQQGNEGVTWEYGEDETDLPEKTNAYILHVADQDGEPVPGVYVNFCTDTACTLLVSDENGVITFDGEPDIYHVQLLKAPAGYSFDSNDGLYTNPAYGEWMLRIRKE